MADLQRIADAIEKVSGRFDAMCERRGDSEEKWIVWKSQVAPSMSVKGGLTRSPGWVIAQYFSSKEEADGYVKRQPKPDRYKVEKA